VCREEEEEEVEEEEEEESEEEEEEEEEEGQILIGLFCSCDRPLLPPSHGTMHAAAKGCA